jgi:hypothetical protein
MKSRLSIEDRMRMSMRLSDRHREWGQDCPAVDLDFMMCEYNHGISVALVEYKHFGADVFGKSNTTNYRAISELYLKDGRQVPLFIARYWPDIWAFRTKAENESATAWASSLGFGWDGNWRDMTEQQFVRMLYRLRKDALNRGDERTIAKLNDVRPPAEDANASHQRDVWNALDKALGAKPSEVHVE